MKKNTITKMIAVSAVLAITMVSLGGCDDTSAASSKSVSSEQAVSAADDVSVSFDETDTSSDTAFDDSIYDYYHHEDFDYYELSEIDGHIIDCGGNAGASDCFIVTDDYKVYHNQYIGGVEYFCTLNGEYESLVPLGGVRENCLITLNKDGSYTAYYADGENGYSVDFKIDNMVSYSAGNNSLSVYTLDDGVVNCTKILKDGTVETDHEKVNFDGASNSGYKWYSVFYTWDCFVDNDGKISSWAEKRPHRVFTAHKQATAPMFIIKRHRKNMISTVKDTLLLCRRDILSMILSLSIAVHRKRFS